MRPAAITCATFLLSYLIFRVEAEYLQCNSLYTDFIAHNEPCALELGIFLQVLFILLFAVQGIKLVLSICKYFEHKYLY